MRTLRIIATAAAVLTLAGCGGAKSQPKVAADLAEWKVALSRTTFTPGKYEFTIHNTGQTQHELIAFKTNLSPSALPVDAKGDVNEDAPALAKATDGDNVHSSKSQTRVVEFKTAGTYVFMCNLPGHFKAGMYKVVTVTG